VTRRAFPAGLQFLQKLLSMLKGLTRPSDLRFGFAVTVDVDRYASRRKRRRRF
jgi:hypothetical protein